MFERLQKPFLTVETGEAYQPIRLSYQLNDPEAVVKLLNQLSCCEKNASGKSWNWFWKAECDDLNFESLDSYQKNPQHPLRLGTLAMREGRLHINLPSFKRACIAVSFFHQHLGNDLTKLLHADFINKVYGIDERLPHGFSELFKDDELEQLVNERHHDYEEVQKRCENAASADEAFKILFAYTKTEAQKRLPYAERYSFEEHEQSNADVLFLGFYIFLRGRELVAIRRWFGETGYNLSDAADETIEQVFGNMDIDILD